MNAHTSFADAFDIARDRLAIGTPCDRPGGSEVAYIVAIAKAEGATFTLFGGAEPMSRDRLTLTLASESGVISEVSENIAAPMIYRARHVPPISEAEAADLWERAKVAQAETRRRIAEEQAAAANAREKAKADLAQIAPPWAQAAIVAELQQDDSDSMTDYYGHKTTRTVVIGWSRHTRDLFAEMRKAAATFAETADLATAPASAEHREKYSMGAGFYLKNGYRHSSGWCVKKARLSWLNVAGLEFSEDARAWASMTGRTPTGEGAAPIGEGGRFSISQHTHTKKGFAMWICTLADRVERDEFDRLNAAAKALGGWYSRPWGKTPGGYAFKSEESARAFVAAEGGER